MAKLVEAAEAKPPSVDRTRSEGPYERRIALAVMSIVASSQAQAERQFFYDGNSIHESCSTDPRGTTNYVAGVFHWLLVTGRHEGRFAAFVEKPERCRKKEVRSGPAARDSAWRPPRHQSDWPSYRAAHA